MTRSRAARFEGTAVNPSIAPALFRTVPREGIRPSWGLAAQTHSSKSVHAEPRTLCFGRRRSAAIGFDHGAGCAIHHDLTVIQPERPLAELPD